MSAFTPESGHLQCTSRCHFGPKGDVRGNAVVALCEVSSISERSKRPIALQLEGRHGDVRASIARLPAEKYLLLEEP